MRTPRVWPSNCLIRLEWIGHLNRSQELFSKMMEEWSWEWFRHNQSCHCHHMPRVQGPRGQHMRPQQVLPHIMGSAPSPQFLSCPGVALVGLSAEEVMVATPAKNTDSNLWQRPQDTISTSIYRAWTWGARLPPPRWRGEVPSKSHREAGAQVQSHYVAILPSYYWCGVVTRVGLEGRASSQGGSFSRIRLNVACPVRFWTNLGPVTHFFFPIFSFREMSVQCLTHTTVFWKHVTCLVSQVHSWRGICLSMNTLNLAFSLP